MNVKHIDLQIDKENPFENCKLARKQYATVLTSIVNNYADGFVLAINNEWGTGKTTFVKMWRQYLSNEGFETLYFNAWENDFESNPLVAIMSELQALKKKENRIHFKSLLEKGAILTKNILPAVVKAVAKRYVDREELVDGIVDSTEAATEILEGEIEEYVSRKRSLKEFRDELEKYLQKIKSSKPVIFFIDELDRCKPNYAVEVLEQMKHFFAVRGIIFVLAVDKTQLGHAVRGVYGSEQLDADEYLRRFIDIEYSIPAPDSKLFNSYLYEYFGFDEFFHSLGKREYRSAADDRENFRSFADLLFENKKPTLRQQEKIFAHTRLALKTFSYGNSLFPNLFLFLVYLRSLERPLYDRLETKLLSLEDLADEYYRIFSGVQDEYKVHGLLYMEARLSNMYNIYRDGHLAESLLKPDKEGESSLPRVESKLDRSENNKKYAAAISSLHRDPERSYTSLEYLLKKINLIDPVVT